MEALTRRPESLADEDDARRASGRKVGETRTSVPSHPNKKPRFDALSQFRTEGDAHPP